MKPFQIGDWVKVRKSYSPGHIRTPFFVRGKSGVVKSMLGNFQNPEQLAYGRSGLPEKTLYRISFKQDDLWPNYTGSLEDTVIVDIYEHWLEPVEQVRG